MLKRLIGEFEESISSTAMGLLWFTALFADILLLGCALLLLAEAAAAWLSLPGRELYLLAEELFSLTGRIVALGAICAFAADVAVRRKL